MCGALVLYGVSLLHFVYVLFFMGRDAGRGDWQVLAAVLEEGLEALCILRGNQGRSQAAPIAFGGQPEADKVARPYAATTYQQNA